MTTKTRSPKTKPAPAGTAAARKQAKRAYEEALREAGVTLDDLQLLRQLAEEGRQLNPHPLPPTRIYL